jgi:membrane protein
VEGSVAIGAGTREVFRRVRSEARTARAKDVLQAFIRTYRENDVLTYASAISFQVFFALIPLLLFALGLIGFLSLNEAWEKDIAPEIKPHVSGPMFQVINDTVNQIVGSKHLFWVSLGGAIAVWEISGAVRAVMQIFNRIYQVEETRPFWRRMRISIGLAAVAGVCLIAAAAIVRFGPLAVDALGASGFLVDVVAFGARWAIALTLLIVVVGVMVRFAPDCRRPLHWVSFGALVVVVGWAVMSIGFWIYTTELADYGSIFASLATVIVTMTYVYASAIVFLTGVQLDALVQDGISATEDRGQKTEDSGSSVRSDAWRGSNGRSQDESSPSPAPPVASG